MTTFERVPKKFLAENGDILSRDEIIQNIENYLDRYPELIELIDHPTGKMWMIVLDKDGKNLRYLKDKTPEMNMYAVLRNGLALQYIENPTLEIILNALGQNGLALRFVKNPCEFMIRVAIKENFFAISFVKNPSEKSIAMAIETSNRMRLNDFLVEPIDIYDHIQGKTKEEIQNIHKKHSEWLSNRIICSHGCYFYNYVIRERNRQDIISYFRGKDDSNKCDYYLNLYTSPKHGCGKVIQNVQISDAMNIKNKRRFDENVFYDFYMISKQRIGISLQDLYRNFKDIDFNLTDFYEQTSANDDTFIVDMEGYYFCNTVLSWLREDENFRTDIPNEIEIAWSTSRRLDYMY